MSFAHGETRTGESGSVPRPRSRTRRIAGLLTRFFLGQGSLQVLNLFVGLYLVRVLSVEQYAQYGLTASFQQTAALLMDLGFASTIIPLIGQRRDDRSLVGRYVRAAKHLRDRVSWLLAPFAVAGFLAIMHRHHWNWITQCFLLISLLLSIYSSGKTAYYSAPLYLYGLLKECYLPQTLTGAARLLAIVVFRVAGMLNGWLAALINAIVAMANGEALQRNARRHIQWPLADDAKTDGEVLRYILPAVPAMVFAAFQVQSAVLLIGVFGRSVGIAQVSALGRLSQLFGVLTIFNAVIIEPFMARLPRERVASRYALLLALAVLACSPLVAFAFIEPRLTLQLLGSKYEGLQTVVGWAMLAGALNYIQLLMWIMNRSRKWVFWRGTFLEIGLTLIAEIVYILFHGVRTASDAVFFSLVSAIGPLITHLYVTLYGLSRPARPELSSTPHSA
jgi:O-antigen/teichoic acid export membrane protein